MPQIKDLDVCQFYACKNPQHDDPSAVLELTLPTDDPEGPPETVIVMSCIYHSAIAHNGDKYVVGRTFRGEIEIRPVAAVPYTPPAPQEA